MDTQKIFGTQGGVQEGIEAGILLNLRLIIVVFIIQVTVGINGTSQNLTVGRKTCGNWLGAGNADLATETFRGSEAPHRITTCYEFGIHPDVSVSVQSTLTPLKPRRLKLLQEINITLLQRRTLAQIDPAEYGNGQGEINDIFDDDS
jgi:hypothetical protein